MGEKNEKEFIFGSKQTKMCGKHHQHNRSIQNGKQV